jgi:hypothetical protein
VYSVCTHKLLVLIHEVQLVFIMNCDLVCEDLESFYLFENIQVEDVDTEKLSKTHVVPW